MNKLERVLSTLDDYKLEDIRHLDVTGASSLFDYMVVATAKSSQHAKSSAEKLQYAFKPEMQEIPKSEGQDYGTWVVVDLGEIIVHIMLTEDREIYSIEALWEELKRKSDETRD